MSINDPLVIRYNERHDFYFVTQGNETFFNKDRSLIVFADYDNALAWCGVNKPGIKVINATGQTQTQLRFEPQPPLSATPNAAEEAK